MSRARIQCSYPRVRCFPEAVVNVILRGALERTLVAEVDGEWIVRGAEYLGRFPSRFVAEIHREQYAAGAVLDVGVPHWRAMAYTAGRGAFSIVGEIYRQHHRNMVREKVLASLQGPTPPRLPMAA